MALTVFWTVRADESFSQILQYLIGEWGEQTAARFVSKVFDLIDTLAEMPEIGTLEQESIGIRGFPITKHTNLFYRISGQRLIVLVFFDNRQHPDKKDHKKKEGFSGE
jgi:plasmid stabilization system protein ParE